MRFFIVLFTLLLSCRSFAITKKIKRGGDLFHQYFSKYVLNYSNRVDQFFLEERELDKDNGTRLIYFHQFSMREYEKYQYTSNIELKLRLPMLSKKIQLAVESTRDENQSINTPDQDQGEEATQGESDTSAKLAWFDTYKKLFSYKASAGVRFSGRPYPLLSLLFFKDWNKNKLNYEASLESRWDGLDGHRELFTFNIGKPLNEDFYLRYHNDVIWFNSTSIFNIYSGPTLSQRISERMYMRYNFRIHYISDDIFALNSYNLNVFLRRKLYKEWLFMNIGMFHNFPKALNYKKDLGGFIRIEVSFGGTPDKLIQGL